MAAKENLDIDEKKSAPKGDFFEVHKKLFVGILVFFALCISVIISVTLSLLLTPKPASTLELEARLGELVESVQSMENSIAEQNLKLDQNVARYEVLQTHLRHTSSTTLKNILIDQEKNFQSFLHVLRAGMRDLSVEVPNGADWYDDYGDQMQKALKRSQQRQELLSLLKTGAVPEESTEAIASPEATP
ncbi:MULTISPECIES: hypothetical protein [unclassified Marinomonas]|uniref:hypothetical protein n=1 Tax=unclassified Marinomonas TaxID=196814 RepID=UPI0006989E06|nr:MULTISPECIES: hypothetical protein [unclassified Marinomonas]